MSSPNLNPQWQCWQTHRHQQTPPQQPNNCYPQAFPRSYQSTSPQQSPYHGQYAQVPGSYVQPHYVTTSPVHLIAELPAPLPPAPPTTTSEEQLKQDELLAHKMQNLEVEEVRRRSSSFTNQHRRPVSMMPPSPQQLTPQPFLHQARSALSLRPHLQSIGSLAEERPVSMALLGTQQLAPPSLLHQRSTQSLRPHAHSVGSITDQRPMIMAPLGNQQLAPLFLTPQRSAQNLRPHSRRLGTASDPWSPGSFNVPPTDPSSFSTLPEVVLEAHPVSYYHPKSPVENFPVSVVRDQWPQDQQPSAQGVPKRPSIALESSSLPAYLEQNLQAPYPPQWSPPPVLSTLFAHREGKTTSGSTWLDTLNSCSWRTIRPTEHARNPIPPSYIFKFKTVSSSFRSPKFSWTMICADQPAYPSQKANWAYELKLDAKTNLRRTEVLAHGGPEAKAVLTTYIHALNYDSLRFIAPDGRAYMWVSSTKLSSIHGSRYDTLRHALFVAAGNIPDPLYGQIAADHCFWDGGEGPDEALYVRSNAVDEALVVATLQVLKDWEKVTLRNEKRAHERAFADAEEEARRCALGKRAYWRAAD